MQFRRRLVCFGFLLGFSLASFQLAFAQEHTGNIDQPPAGGGQQQQQQQPQQQQHQAQQQQQQQQQHRHWPWNLLERHQSQQQQQQAPKRFIFAKKVVRGDEAAEYFNSNSAEGILTDLSAECTEPVKQLAFGHLPSICFDRGPNFKHSSRFKCYISTYQLISKTKARWFKWFHNKCGGDGIYPVSDTSSDSE